MQENDKSQDKLYRYCIILIGIYGVVLLFMCTAENGLGLSPDSTRYISGAHSFASGGAIKTIGGAPFILWPPLYPSVLGIFKVVGFDVLFIARIINLILYGLLIYLTGMLLYHSLSEKWLSLCGAIIVSVSFPLMKVFVMLWTEPLFSFLSMAAAWFFFKLIRHGDQKYWVILAIVCALLPLQRYIGVSIVIAIIALLLVFLGDPFIKRLKKVILFAGIAFAPLFIWLLRNYLIYGSLTGERNPSSISLIDNLAKMAKIILWWFFSNELLLIERLLYLSVIAMFVIGIYVLYIFTEREGGLSRFLCEAICIAILIIYIFTQLSASTLVAMDPMNDRFLSPMFAFAIVILLLSMDKLIVALKKRKSFHNVLYVIVLMFLFWPFVHNASRIYGQVLKPSVTYGNGTFTNKFWSSVEITGWLKVNRDKLDRRIFSNAPHAVYVSTYKYCSTGPRVGSPFDVIDNYMSQEKWKGSYYILVRDYPKAGTYDMAEAREFFKNRIEYEFIDGLIISY